MKVQKGSGHWTQRTYDAEDGLLTAIKTGPTIGAASIQNLTFSYDGLGNLRTRVGSGGSETLGYDSLNRLTASKQGSIAYYDNGNIRRKPDVSGAMAPVDFTYDTAHPHAVATAFGYTMGYDANGNLASRTKTDESWDLRYAGFDKPRWMTKTAGAVTTGSEFLYNANRSRTVQLEYDAVSGGVPSHYVRKRVYGLGSTLEANYENQAASGAADWKLRKVRIYVPGPDGVVGAREFDPAAAAGSQEKALVYHYDHLGSVESITPFGTTTLALAHDPTGQPGRYSEDAWGQRRNPSTWTGAPSATDDGGFDSLTPRGFTGHEMLDDLGLVHMNGRIYDPLLGRFLSADTIVQVPGSLQSYNRYSYVHNNPLSFTDPTGEAAPEVIVIGGGIIVAGGAVAIMSTTPQGRQAAADLSNSVVRAVSQSKGNFEQKAQIGAMVAVLKFVSWFKGTAEHRTDNNAIANPQTGDKGKIANTQSNVEASKDKPATSTASPAPTTPKAEEGFTASPSGATQTETPAANPADTPTTTGSPAPAADVPLSSDMAQGIYEFPDQTAGGQPYVGQSSDTDRRLSQHEAAGRLQPGTQTVTDVAGGKTQREIAEHKRIQTLTGGEPASKSDKVSNKVDPIGPKRRHLLDEDKK